MVRRCRWLGFGLFALALGLAANSVLGPLFLETIRYHYSESLINQGIGLDAVVLFGAVPIAVAAGVLILRGHMAGPILAFIPTTFAAYMAPQYVVGPEYLELPGNNEQYFVFHLALFVLAVVLLFGAWGCVDRDRLVPASGPADRRRSWVMFGVAAFILLGRWLPGIVDLVDGDPSGADYLENPTAYLLIGVLDLGVVVPAAVVAGIGLRRNASWARTAAYAVTGWFALVPASVAAMAITMQVNDDPNATTGATVLFSVAAVIFTVGAALLYRPLFGGGDGRFGDGRKT
ncbi:MAG: hypothetical protein R2823_04910 [Acidimicrobiia bacterium]